MREFWHDCLFGVSFVFIFLSFFFIVTLIAATTVENVNTGLTLSFICMGLAIIPMVIHMVIEKGNKFSMLKLFELISDVIKHGRLTNETKSSDAISYRELRRIVLDPRTDDITLMMVCKKYEEGIIR